MKLKIAICDDDALQRDYLSEVAASWAKRNRHLAEIRQYAEPKAFLFDYSEEKDFDILLLDIEMPEMNGIELTRRLRKVIGNETPIIILTAYDWADIEAEAKEAGVTAFCSKPVFLSELREVLAAPYMGQEQEAETEASGLDFTGKKILLV